MMRNEASSSNRSLLSVINDFATSDALLVHGLHRFSEDSEPTISQLKQLIDATVNISGSLNAHVTLPLTNPKLHSLLRQETGITHTVHNATQTVNQTVKALRKRIGILYGEDIPLDKDALVSWCTARFEAWGTAAGMEVFKEDERDNRITIMLGGKVIVIDMELAADRTNQANPVLTVTSVKTSFAVSNGSSGSTSSGSTSLDGFLTDAVRSFLSEVQKDPEDQDPEKAAQIGLRFAEDLKYLMKLDQLAVQEGDNGLRCFNACDLLALEVERFATTEASVISKEISVAQVPLNLFLMRAHALPLPYITIPSISWLVYLSPQAYLTMRRNPTSAPPIPPNPFLPLLDVPFEHIRSYVSAHPRKPGVTIASLVLSSEGPRLPHQPDELNMDALATRPTFSPGVIGGDLNIVFPVLDKLGVKGTMDARFYLDFTDGGKYPGVIMSQTRMREIETLVNPLAGLDQLHHMPVVTTPYGAGSWLDPLVNPTPSMTCERYTAIYVSPNSVHPPLQLRLLAPDEPGFWLEKVPVRSMKEIWGILEIVREQCWLNETLSSLRWSPEGLHAAINGADPRDEEATEDELQAVLGGTVAPRSIPVNVSVPSQTPHDLLFEDLDAITVGTTRVRSAQIVMTTPERPPISGLVEITVVYDCNRPQGIALTINGGLGADLRLDVLEEVCLRGGLLGLPGRIWAKSHSLS